MAIQGDKNRPYDRFQRQNSCFQYETNVAALSALVAEYWVKARQNTLTRQKQEFIIKAMNSMVYMKLNKPVSNLSRLVVVEGYMDVVALAQHGVDYAVASLGTATTA